MNMIIQDYAGITGLEHIEILSILHNRVQTAVGWARFFVPTSEMVGTKKRAHPTAVIPILH